jgi:16S rRNA (adenine1518-N6/adenine1519-N6)-dimethyltransferase
MSHPPTQSEIRAILATAGLQPRRRLGQHFLIDSNLLHILVEEADLSARDVVLEVGAGVGNLTELLLDAAAWVVAVEIDPDLAAVARERLAGAANLDLLVADALADKHHVSPEVLAAARARLAEIGGRPFDGAQGRPERVEGRLKLVANLPYSAATPLVVELLLEEPTPALMLFTVQEEVARRLAAEPATRPYGPVSVVVQALAQVEVVRRLGPTVFWPRPEVWSAMVRIRPSPARRRRIADLVVFRRVVEGLFRHRRKRAPRSLALADPGGEPAEAWAARLEAAGLDPLARGETYSVDQIIRLANVVAGKP